MPYLDLTLLLVNRALRWSGQYEALEHEESAIRASAALGSSVEWIAAQIRSTRTMNALED